MFLPVLFLTQENFEHDSFHSNRVAVPCTLREEASNVHSDKDVPCFDYHVPDFQSKALY